MSPSPVPHRRRFSVIFFVTLLAAILFVVAFAALHPRDWSVPPEAKSRKNPVALADFSANDTRALYREKCASCHGNLGKGDGDDPPLWGPRPTDLTDAAHIGAQSDGELFFKITEGKRPMPSFKNRLSDRQRWELVLFLRSLSGALPSPSAQMHDAKAPSPQ